MMTVGTTPAEPWTSLDVRRAEQRVVDLARDLAREVSGDRAAAAVTATASLERDAGLGSLERVELLMRLERALGRDLDEGFLLLDTPRDIAHALSAAPVLTTARITDGGALTAAGPAVTLNVDAMRTLVDALEQRARAEPERRHVLLLSDGNQVPATYAELRNGAMRIGAALRARGLERGEPVAIMLPTGLDYLQSFMGVLAGGGVAVPLYPPARLDRMEEYLRRQSRILANAGARFLIAMPEAVPVARLLRASAPALAQTLTVDALRGTPATSPVVAVAPDDPALIQYTSGSTGDPKGVLLTHANLLANIRAIAAGVDMRPTDVAVSWLPLYHDMGLIGTWLACMVEGIPLTLMPPLAFLAHPERWLWAIHRQRATLSVAPNFAYELCVRKVRDEAIEGLDLSSWRCALNGSEPVSAATLERFAARYGRYGFRREALLPVYGLAECSVALCFPPVGRGPLVDQVSREPFGREGRALPAPAGEATPLTFVSVGRALPQHEVRLVDEAGQGVAERVVGRLLFRGPSCMQAYHHNAGATARTVRPDGWLDSGDLAYLAAGELFITGRVKDLIIKGGRNLVPQEVEEVAGSVEGIRKGCVAAFGVMDEGSGTERLVVIAESRVQSRDQRERLEREVVAAIAAGVGLPPDVVQVVAPGTVPKTPSGKIRRAAARDGFVAGAIAERRGPSLRLRARLLAAKVPGGLRATARVLMRGAGVTLVIAAWLVAAVVVGPVALLLLYALPHGRAVRTLSRFVSRVMLATSGCRVEVDGVARLPRGPCVLVANHASYADTPILLSVLSIDFVFVAMQEVLTWPLVGALVRCGGHPTVDRHHATQSVAHAVAVEARLRAGESLLFFPEGGFSASAGLRPFRLGAFRAAVATGTSVVPVAISGSRRLLRDGSFVPHPGRVHVWIGEPLSPRGTDWRAIVDLRDRVVAAIAAHCGEPRLEP